MEGKTTLGPHGIPGEDVRAWVPCLELLWGCRVRAHIHEHLLCARHGAANSVAL